MSFHLTRRAPLWLLACVMCGWSALLGAEVLTVGVVPQHNPTRLAEEWGPLLQRVAAVSGIQLRFRTAPDIPMFEERLAAGEYDLAYMNPYHYRLFSENPGYRALLHARNQALRGILVVRRDSPIESLAALEGAEIAFPSPAAFAATLLVRAEFAAQGHHITPRYVASHDSVYHAVIKGLYPAGGGVVRTLLSMAPEVRDQLRVIWTSQPYTPHPIATHPRLSEAQRSRLRDAFVALADDPLGRSLLDSLHIDGWQAAEDSDWADVRALQLDPEEGAKR